MVITDLKFKWKKLRQSKNFKAYVYNTEEQWSLKDQPFDCICFVL